MFTRRNLLNGDARAVFIFINGLLLGVAVAFYFDTFKDNGTSFGPEIWGNMAYAFPARSWSIALAVSSAACIIGLVRPVLRWLLIGGAVAQVLQNVILAYSAIYTGGTMVVGFYACGFFMMIHLWVLVEAILYRASEHAG